MEQNQKSVPHRGATAVPHTEHTLRCRGGRRERHQMTRRTAPSKPTLHRSVACILHSLELCQNEFWGEIVKNCAQCTAPMPWAYTWHNCSAIV